MVDAQKVSEAISTLVQVSMARGKVTGQVDPSCVDAAILESYLRAEDFDTSESILGTTFLLCSGSDHVWTAGVVKMLLRMAMSDKRQTHSKLVIMRFFQRSGILSTLVQESADEIMELVTAVHSGDIWNMKIIATKILEDLLLSEHGDMLIEKNVNALVWPLLDEYPPQLATHAEHLKIQYFATLLSAKGLAIDMLVQKLGNQYFATFLTRIDSCVGSEAWQRIILGYAKMQFTKELLRTQGRQDLQSVLTTLAKSSDLAFIALILIYGVEAADTWLQGSMTEALRLIKAIALRYISSPGGAKDSAVDYMKKVPIGAFMVCLFLALDGKTHENVMQCLLVFLRNDLIGKLIVDIIECADQGALVTALQLFIKLGGRKQEQEMIYNCLQSTKADVLLAQLLEEKSPLLAVGKARELAETILTWKPSDGAAAKTTTEIFHSIDALQRVTDCDFGSCERLLVKHNLILSQAIQSFYDAKERYGPSFGPHQQVMDRLLNEPSDGSGGGAAAAPHNKLMRSSSQSV